MKCRDILHRLKHMPNTVYRTISVLLIIFGFFLFITPLPGGLLVIMKGLLMMRRDCGRSKAGGLIK